MYNRIVDRENNEEFETLIDIVPKTGLTRVLFVAKVPTSKSVEAGHYFQGRQGTTFWNKLKKYRIIDVPFGAKDDDHLLENLCGIMDIVKRPREYGEEPSIKEYKEGIERIIKSIREI